MNIYLDETSTEPKYQQIANQLCLMIQRGELKPGQKLPPERELGKENKIARGTVQMAYQELIQEGFAYAVRGSGTYIINPKQNLCEEVLTKEIEHVFERADQLGMESAEVVELFRNLLMLRTAGDVKLMTAWVDCCPEALQLATNEFKNVAHNCIHQFLLENVIREPQLLQNKFDLIVVTTHHYETFIQVFPELLNKIRVVTIIVSKETLIELAQISPDTRVTIWSISKVFLENLLWHIRDLKNINIVKTFISDKGREEIEASLKQTDLLITSKEYWNLGEPAMINLIEQYKKAGGRVLFFEYVFDEGSLLHLQTCICEKIAEKEKRKL